MPSTRSSSRQQSADSNSSQESHPRVAAGSKRKPDAASLAGNSKKQQKTIDETISGNGRSDGADMEDVKHDVVSASQDQADGENGTSKAKEEVTEKSDDPSTENGGAKNGSNGKDTSADKSIPPKELQREEHVSTNIHEKGLIYFFFRGRVGIEEPQGVQDLARSYIVLRPLPLDSKIGDGPIEDHGKNRLLALPKKVLPKSPRDRFM